MPEDNETQAGIGCIFGIALMGTVALLAVGHYGAWILLLLLVPVYGSLGEQQDRYGQLQEERRSLEEQERQEEQRRQEELRCRFTASELRYFQILGVEPGASFAEIKKGYHKRCLQYHPDTVAHLGEEYKRIAGKKMQAINEAYDYFERNFK